MCLGYDGDIKVYEVFGLSTHNYLFNKRGCTVQRDHANSSWNLNPFVCVDQKLKGQELGYCFPLS